MCIGEAGLTKRNSLFFASLILITLSSINCVNVFDYPKIIQVTGIVTYQSDGSPVDRALVHMWQYDFGDDINEIGFQPYMHTVARTWTNEDGEYKIIHSLKDPEHCCGDIFSNIHAYKFGYLHNDWLNVKVYCTEELQNIHFQLFEID